MKVQSVTFAKPVYADMMLPQAVAALPQALQEEARRKDYSLFPIERRVFTDTAPIPNFKEMLTPESVD